MGDKGAMFRSSERQQIIDYIIRSKIKDGKLRGIMSYFGYVSVSKYGHYYYIMFLPAYVQAVLSWTRTRNWGSK